MRDHKGARVDESAVIDPACFIGEDTVVWGMAQVREDAVIGQDCVIGRGAYLGPGVTVGARCKIQNGAFLYEPARLGEGVFVGPGVVLTNDTRPRAVNPDGSRKGSTDWVQMGVVIQEGASLGANSVCVAPVTIGAWALVAAGSVVTRDVADFSLVAGVPARHVAWVGRAGTRLIRTDDSWTCPDTLERFIEHAGRIVPISTSTPATSSASGELDH